MCRCAASARHTQAPSNTNGYTVNVGAGRTARLRLCYAGFNFKFKVLIDGHAMAVIAKDGTNVKPVWTDSVHLRAGERIDVLVPTDAEKPGLYTIHFHASCVACPSPPPARAPPPSDTSSSRARYRSRARSLAEHRTTGRQRTPRDCAPRERASRCAVSRGSAKLSYPAPLRSPPPLRLSGSYHGLFENDTAVETEVELSRGAVNATLNVMGVDEYGQHATSASAAAHEAREELEMPDSLPWVETVDLSVNVGALRSKEDGLVPSQLVADKTVPLVITAGYPTFNKDTYLKRTPTDYSDTSFWRINNNSWVDPTTPLYLSKGKYGKSEVENYKTYVIDLAHGDVVDIVVIQNGEGSTTMLHPMHMHGYKFWVVGSGPLPYPGRVADVPNLNLKDPVLADTFPVATGNYYVFRLVADNPGMWHFHCHLLYHMFMGLQVVFNVAEELQPAPPTAYYEGLEAFTTRRDAADDDDFATAAAAAVDAAAVDATEIERLKILLHRARDEPASS